LVEFVIKDLRCSDSYDQAFEQATCFLFITLAY